MTELTLGLIDAAREALAGQIRHTPVEVSPELSAVLGVPVWLKLECLQTTGSFKLRGALFRLLQLSARERAQGVATCSAGNHGKALAYAARELGIEATVYVPASIDEVKVRGINAQGAKVVRSAYPGFDETQTWALKQIAANGQIFVSPFDDEWIMAGNGGTLAAEVYNDLPEARAFVLPVSGGGLSAGFSYFIRARLPDAQIIGCQHRDSASLLLSLDRGEAVTALPPINTLAGGLEGGIGARAFGVLRDRIDAVALVSEEEIYQAVRWTLDRHQYLVEPSGAATVAACIFGRVPKLQGPAVVVLSGRNVGLAAVNRIMNEG